MGSAAQAVDKTQVAGLANQLVQAMKQNGYTPSQVVAAGIKAEPKAAADIIVAAMGKVCQAKPEMAARLVDDAFVMELIAAIKLELQPPGPEPVGIQLGAPVAIGAAAPTGLSISDMARAILLREAAARTIRVSQQDYNRLIEEAGKTLPANATSDQVTEWARTQVGELESKMDYVQARKAVSERLTARNWRSDSEIEEDDLAGGVIGAPTYNAVVRAVNTSEGELTSERVDAFLDLFGLTTRAHSEAAGLPQAVARVATGGARIEL